MKLKPMSMGLLAMVGLVGPSRIYEGHHWPTDVTASYLLGTAYVIGLTALSTGEGTRAGS
ncbi:MAG: phosphatase PAP2 family protein [Halobacteriota archaeon]